jgi:capsular exopolysaccharide synthesis family protein
MVGEDGIYRKSSIKPALGRLFDPHLISFLGPLSSVAESYRNLRTNLQFAHLDRPLKSVMVTSANPSEGKSTTVANLAIIFAQAGKKVLLVDADVHRPILHKFFDSRRIPGLSDYILGNSTYDEVVQENILNNLDIICSGTMPPNPAELPGSQNMKTLIKLAMKIYDVVLLDSPPVLSATGASVLATEVDGTVLVVSYDNTRAPDIESAMESLVSVGATVLGVLLNNFDARKAYGGYTPTSRYGYGYAGYGQDARGNG